MTVERILIGTAGGLFDLDGPVAFAERDVSHLADGWAVVDGEPHRRAGAAWDALPVGEDVEVTCIAEQGDDDALAGTAGAHLVRLRDGRALPIASFDAAPTRDEWYTPWGGPPDVRSLALAPDGTWFVNVHVGGILRSAGDGRAESWVATIDLDTDVHQVRAVDGMVVAALGLGGVAISHDRGASWSLHDDGLHATYCRAVAVAGDTILLSASSGPGGRDAAVYRRAVDADGAFERCGAGLPARFGDNVDTHCLDASGDAAVLGTSSGEVYRSEDAGRSWDQVASGLPRIRCVELGSASGP